MPARCAMNRKISRFWKWDVLRSNWRDGNKKTFMKTPPFLLGATLLFWGWQSDLLVAGAIMAVILESARFVSVRWDFSETEIRRIWNFCTLLSFTMAVYAFTSSEEGGNFMGLFQGAAAFHNATVTTVRTATAFLRWLPLVFIPGVAAQVFSVGDTMPLTAASRRLRRRRNREIKRGKKITPVRDVNITYPYFMVCLFSAGIHANEGSESFFWGQCVLIIWALAPFRSRRFGAGAWAPAVAVAVGIAFLSQRGVRELQRAIEGYNAQWMARFFHGPTTDPKQSMTAMGQIGRLKLSGKIVIRLWTENGESPPTYLREASYRGYNGARRSWFAGNPQRDFESVIAETNQTTFVLLPGKTNNASAKIACYLIGRSSESGNPSGLLPLPTGSGRLENLNAYGLQKNPEGAVLAEGPGLVIFDALYGPGATIDSPPENNFSTTNFDFSVPTNEIPALDRVFSENHLLGRNEQQTLQNVYGFFQGKFTYSLWQGRDKLSRSNETALTRFLLFSRSGHCEYFATATVLLLRELKIPARYAVGYAVHEKSGKGYVARQRDAHSWCLVWNEKTKIWEDFDTTPGSWIEMEGKRASLWERFSDFLSWIGFEISKLKILWGQGKLREYIFWSLIPIFIFLLYQIIFG